MRHRDSAGHEGLLPNGGVQWMTAGRGVIHSELPEQEDGRMEGFQLWLNLPAKDKMRAPWYRDIQSAEIPEFTTRRRREGARHRRREPRRGRRDAARRDRAAVPRPRAARGCDASRRRCRPRTTRSSTSIAAALTIGGTRGAGAAHGDPRERAETATASCCARDAPTRALLIAGRPLGEPIAQYGPFVMNTNDEIFQAVQDYQAGKFAATA